MLVWLGLETYTDGAQVLRKSAPENKSFAGLRKRSFADLLTLYVNFKMEYLKRLYMIILGAPVEVNKTQGKILPRQ